MRRVADCRRCLLLSRFEDIKRLNIRSKSAEDEIKKIADSMRFWRTPAFSKSFRVIEKFYGKRDPYKNLKRRYTCKANELLKKFRDRNIQNMIRMVAYMNSFDTNVLGYTFNENEFRFNGEIAIDRSEVIKSLKCLRIAYVLDNAGEHVYDLELIKYLSTSNDVDVYVREDPYEIDIISDNLGNQVEDRFHIIATKGNISPIYLRDFKRYDLVISKGIANLEAALESWLQGFNIENFLFIFKAKCPIIANAFGIRHKSFVIATWESLEEKISLEKLFEE